MALDLNTNDVRAEKLLEPEMILSCIFWSLLNDGQRETKETARNFWSSSKVFLFNPVSLVTLLSSHTQEKVELDGIGVLSREQEYIPTTGLDSLGMSDCDHV